MDARGSTVSRSRFRTGDSRPSVRAAASVSAPARARSICAAGRPSPASSTTTITSSCSGFARAITRRSSRRPRLPTCRPRSRRARSRCRPARSSPRWADGTRRSSRRSACRRWPSSTPRRPSTQCWCSRASPVRPRRTREARRSSPSKGVAVSDTGAIGANAPSMAALNALRAVQTFEDKKRGTADAMAYSVERRRDDERGHGRVQPARHTRSPGLVRSRHARQRRSVAHVRRVRRAASRRQDDRAPARLLPDDGYAARCADPVRAAAE